MAGAIDPGSLEQLLWDALYRRAEHEDRKGLPTGYIGQDQGQRVIEQADSL